MIPTPELQKLKEFEVMIRSLLGADKYIARKDYLWLRDEYKDVFITFSKLISTGMLQSYCETNHVESARIKQFVEQYGYVSDPNGGKAFATHNQHFIERHLQSDKGYLDSILKPIDPAILLDEEQRKVVLSDEDYTLVIAGAGAGKTTTVAAKVRYLVEKKKD